MNTTNKKLGASMALFLALLTIILGFIFLRKSPPSTISLLNIADFTDDRVLVGVAENVFAAKITEDWGQKEIVELPVTQFSGEVVENLKGKTPRLVTLNQLPESDAIILESDGSFNHPAPLQVGSTYLFSSWYDEEEKHHNLLMDPKARILISPKASLSADQLKEVLHTHPRYIELKKALKDEITLEEYDAQRRAEEEGKEK